MGGCDQLQGRGVSFGSGGKLASFVDKTRVASALTLAFSLVWFISLAWVSALALLLKTTPHIPSTSGPHLRCNTRHRWRQWAHPRNKNSRAPCLLGLRLRKKRGAALWPDRRRPWASRKLPSDSQNAGRASSVPDAESSQRSFVATMGEGEAPQKTPTAHGASNVMHTATRSLSGALAHKGLRLTHFFHRQLVSRAKQSQRSITRS